MTNQTQIKSESHEHSAVRLARNTMPPSPVASMLVEAEQLRAQGDTVLTMHERPEIVGYVAGLLNVEPVRVRIHITMFENTLVQAIFIDGRIRQGKAANRALNRINLPGTMLG